MAGWFCLLLVWRVRSAVLMHSTPPHALLPSRPTSQNEGVDKGDLLGLKITQGGAQAAQRVGLLCGVDGID